MSGKGEYKADQKENQVLENVKPQGKHAEEVRVKSYPIVGLGGSAGALPAFETFFNHLPKDSGMAFIVIMHLEPDHQSQFASIIQKYTPMPVLEAKDGVLAEPNHVYVIPPDKDLGMHNRHLLLLPGAKPKGYRLPIDYFFKSLAEDQWNKAVGIIFSGMGSDGETGLRMIKEKLGLVIVQDPETARYNSMPLAAIDTNLVDYVLSPEEIPSKLIQYLNHPAISEEAGEHEKQEIRETNALSKILMLLRSHTGHDFSLYKKNTLGRRIDRRVAFHQLKDYAQYVEYLRENPHEIDVLFNEILIGVTKFFRDDQAFTALKGKLNSTLGLKKEMEPIRVWVAGCSTGEEAYSIAILIMEYLEKLQLKKLPKVQIFATDLDADAIERARAGLYHENIVADVSEDRLTRFFTRKDQYYMVKKELRETIVFAQHNLIKDAPFTRLDLLSCRNVMIYLTTELQKKIIPIFHYALNPRGIFFMGPAETIGGFTDLFSPIDPKWKLFERQDGSSSLGKMVDFPFSVSRQQNPAVRFDETSRTPVKKTLADTFTKVLLDNYTPTSLLVTEKGEILYINGKTGKFLELNTGEATINIHHMARPELKYPLSNALHQAKQKKQTIVINDIKMKEAEDVRLVNLQVSYMEDTELHGLFTVVFEDKGIQKKNEKKQAKNEFVKNVVVEELERELLFTKQQLHTTIEQMETSLEELKSTNEELQSTNEELQSTNEESLTTKEEMQSLNEELMTINIQYQDKAEELTQLNNDMKNMLDSTEIATIFLDNQLNILRYTPQVKKLFNLIPADMGRSISHVVSNFDYTGLEADINQVLESLAAREIEIKTRSNDWYSLRIMPYRTLDNFISGAVLTFSKITALKAIQRNLKTLEEYTIFHLNRTKTPVALLDQDLNIIAINTGMTELLNTVSKRVKGGFFPEVAKKGLGSDSFFALSGSEIPETIHVQMGQDGIQNAVFTIQCHSAQETNESIFTLISQQQIGTDNGKYKDTGFIEGRGGKDS